MALAASSRHPIRAITPQRYGASHIPNCLVDLHPAALPPDALAMHDERFAIYMDNAPLSPTCSTDDLRANSISSGNFTPIQVSPRGSSSNLSEMWVPGSPRSEKVVKICKNCNYSFRVRVKQNASDFCGKGEQRPSRFFAAARLLALKKTCSGCWRHPLHPTLPSSPFSIALTCRCCRLRDLLHRFLQHDLSIVQEGTHGLGDP